MSLANVLSNTNFVGYSAAHELELRNAITNLYNNSPTAQAILDKVGNGTHPLKFNFSAGAASASTSGSGNVWFDPDFVDDYIFLDETGTANALTVERVLIHEVIHAVELKIDEPDQATSSADLIRMTDYRGSTVIMTNKVMNELGELTGRIGYHAVALRSQIAPGTEFTGDAPIDAAFVAGSGSLFWDMNLSGRTTNDLLIGSNSNDFIKGGAGDDFIFGNSGFDQLFGDGGDDKINSGFGNDLITLGGGDDTLSGSLSSLSGDTVRDFSDEDFVEIIGQNLSESHLSYSTAFGFLGIDVNNDGFRDAIIYLDNGANNQMMVVNQGGNTYVSFESLFPSLVDRVAVDGNSVNGVINQMFLTGDGSTEFRATLQGSLMGAAFNNTLGVYEIDANGNITDVRILFNGSNDNRNASADILGVEDGNSLGFFLVQNGADWAKALAASDTLSFSDGAGGSGNVNGGPGTKLAVNGVDADLTIFHSFNFGLNGDGVEHVLSGVNPGGGGITIGFEDLYSGGDQDYQDIVFIVEALDLV